MNLRRRTLGNSPNTFRKMLQKWVLVTVTLMERLHWKLVVGELVIGLLVHCGRLHSVPTLFDVCSLMEREKIIFFFFFTVLSSLSVKVLSLLVRYFEQFEIQNWVVSCCHHGPVFFFLSFFFCSVLFFCESSVLRYWFLPERVWICMDDVRGIVTDRSRSRF